MRKHKSSNRDSSHCSLRMETGWNSEAVAAAVYGTC